MEIEQYYKIMEYAAVVGIGTIFGVAGIGYLVYRSWNNHLEGYSNNIFSESELEQELNQKPKRSLDSNI